MAMHLYADSKFTSPYSMSVFVALTEKQLPFEIRTLDLDTGANNDPDYVRISLTQRVPTLIDRGFALSESSAIAEYLDDTFPDPPIFPPDRQHRARARQVQAWLRSDFMPIRQEPPRQASSTGSPSPRPFPRRRRCHRESSAWPPPDCLGVVATICLTTGPSPMST